MTTNNQLNPKKLPIVLVLQGGGALGAYQAGVYQAMHEHDLVPDWIVGTSIGAINAALIAGNRQENRLTRVRQFWDRVSHDDNFNMNWVGEDLRRSNIWLNTVDTVLKGAPGFFKPRMFSGFSLGMKVAPEHASFYDTSPLNDTMQELVDFDYLNRDKDIRLTITAVNVGTGDLTHFDSHSGNLCADHVRASGSLPPAFAGVRIDGELYWDGGLYSNTPLESVLRELPKGDTLCFMVDLWSADGAEPDNIEAVRTRLKDVTYASRSRRHIEDYALTHRMQRKLRELYARVPPESCTGKDEKDLLELGCASTLHIVRLPYGGHDWNMAAKDINFSKGSINWRWDQGYADAMRALNSALWLQHVTDDTSVVVHELLS